MVLPPRATILLKPTRQGPLLVHVAYITLVSYDPGPSVVIDSTATQPCCVRDHGSRCFTNFDVDMASATPPPFLEISAFLPSEKAQN